MKRGWGGRTHVLSRVRTDRIVYEIFMEVKYWGNTHPRDKPDDKAPWKRFFFFSRKRSTISRKSYWNCCEELSRYNYDTRIINNY